MKRYGSVIKVRPERLEQYKRLHAEVWPDVLRMIKECGISNYSIYYKDGYLFSYFEYSGDDYEAIWPAWRRIRRHNAGGRSASRARSGSIRPQTMSGGRPWKNCFTWIDRPTRGERIGSGLGG
ncbi:L-rhamnose mutarotase [Gordoniibacillus kamchatkensis]|nr:L-rhamnose mutarotase [Paenibacillus sp. VKM B-2647]